LSYSGRTPAKFALSEMLDTYKYYTFDEDEEQRVKEHDVAELASALIYI
jgi:hypothetical protein